MALDQKLRTKTGLETKLVSLRDSASGNNQFDITISSDSDVLKFTGDQGTTFSIGDSRKGIVEVAGDSSNIFSVKDQSGVHYFDVDSSKAVRIGATDADVTLLVGLDSADSRYKVEVSGTTKSTYFKGDGSLLTNLPTTTIQYINVDSDFTALPGKFYLADTTAGGITATLPASPNSGDFVVVSDASNFATNNVTVARNGSTIEDSAGDVILDVQQTENRFVYNGSTWHIFVTAGINEDPPYSTTDFDSDALAIIDSAYIANRLGGGTGVTINTIDNTINIGQSVAVGDTVSFAGVTAGGGGVTVNGNIVVNDAVSRSITSPRLNLTGDGEDVLVLQSALDSVATPTADVSIVINRGISPNVSIMWDEDSDRWLLENAAGNFYEILTRENEGPSPAAGGIDADKLESQEGTYYLNYDNFSNTPTSITQFNIVDGNSGQFLRTDGAGNFTFANQPTLVAGAGFIGQEDYYYSTANPTTTFATEANAYSRMQVFRNGILLDANQWSFDSATGDVTLTQATDSGDIVTLWGFSSTGIPNHELMVVDSDGNVDFPGYIRIGTRSLIGTEATTIATTTPTNVLLYGTDSFVGAELLVTIEDTVTNETQISKSIILTVDSSVGGGTPLITTYGTIYSSDSALATFDVTKSAADSDTRLEVTMASANSSRVKIAYNLMAAG